MTKRITVNATDAFHEAVVKYQQQQEIKSLAEAMLQLASIGLYIKTGQRPPEYSRAWGGEWRKGMERDLSEIEIDRLNVLLGGWPPLADDDED